MTPNGFLKRTTGLGQVNENEPFGNNPFINIPADTDRNPCRLVLTDLGYIFQFQTLLIKIILPLYPLISGELDELYPSWPNIKDLTLHTFLLVTQFLLLVSLPALAVMFWFVPGVAHIIFGTILWGATWVVMRLLNGWPTTQCLVGMPDGLDPVNDEKELWFFINGVATGYVDPEGLRHRLTKAGKTGCSPISISLPERSSVKSLESTTLRRSPTTSQRSG